MASIVSASDGATGRSEEADTNSSTPTAAGEKFLASRLQVLKNGKGDFTSCAISRVSLPPGALFATLDQAVASNRASWSSVQVGRDEHIELHSDLVYTNHSCAPNLEFDTERREVRVARDQAVKEGDVLTFFYPSSEWSMAQPFRCNCGADRCLQQISGANKMDEGVLKRYWLNTHIEELLRERPSQ